MPKIKNILNYAQKVKSQTGKSYSHQLQDIVRLRYSSKPIGITEYYQLQFFDESFCKIKKFFIGRRYSAFIDKICNINSWRVMAEDKIVNYCILRNLNFPIPGIIATYSKLGRRIGNEIVLKSENDIIKFLSQNSVLPLFMKPVHGYLGRGVFGIEKVNIPHNDVLLINGEHISFDKLLATALTPKYDGAIFQNMVLPSPEIAEIFGKRISCIRIIAFLSSKGPKVHIAFWKIAREHNMVDNFDSGKLGNMLGWIDIETGSLDRIIGGFWPNTCEITDHPDTGKKMKGFIIKLKFHRNYASYFQATMRSRVLIKDFFRDLGLLRQTASKSSFSAALAMMCLKSEKAKLLRPLTLCRRSGMFSSRAP